jgi:hypothetical protein
MRDDTTKDIGFRLKIQQFVDDVDKLPMGGDILDVMDRMLKANDIIHTNNDVVVFHEAVNRVVVCSPVDGVYDDLDIVSEEMFNNLKE